MNILVTGAGGQVGAEIVRRAADAPGKVIGLRRSDLDITDSAAVEATLDRLDPDLVVNAAAYTAVDRAEEETEAAASVNRDGAGNLARGCSLRGIPLFHFSTDYVFDGEPVSDENPTEPTKEDHPARPLNVYGRTKLQGEEAVRQELPQHLILRISWVFSAHGHNFVLFCGFCGDFTINSRIPRRSSSRSDEARSLMWLSTSVEVLRPLGVGGVPFSAVRIIGRFLSPRDSPMGIA